MQLSAARDAAAEYEARSAKVVAVNPGSMESHCAWSDEFGFHFPICVDIDKKVATAYGALKPEGGIMRTVVVIDKGGRVAWAKQGMPATEEVLAAIDAIGS